MTSFRVELEPREEASANLIAAVGEQLQMAFVEAKDAQGLTQQGVARLLDVDRSWVNKCLNGYSNLTLKTLAELGWAMAKVVHVKFCSPTQQVVVSEERGRNLGNRSVFAEPPRPARRPRLQVRRRQGGTVHATVAIGF